MRFIGVLPIVFMVGLGLYAFWDLKIDGFQPPVPADKLADSNPEIEAIMAPHREALKTGLSNRIVPQIDESLALIAEEFGETSPEMNQALVETSIMLSQSSRADLADDYMLRAVDVSREVYGTVHRETALALNDLANLITDAQDLSYSEESIGHLQEAMEIRQAVLPADHPEVIVNEVNLADQLFLQWQNEGLEEDKSNLDTAASLLSHVMSVHAEQADTVNALDKASVQLLFARVSFYRDDFENAAKYFSETLSPVAPETDPATYLVFSNSYAEHITSLSELGQTEEADKMRADIIGYLQANTAPEESTPATSEE
ncbi:MAG: tetratricopeptide repeat protein [Aquisalinus sp.]|nr:tetratricopeptide repeat protein [Aquisalinus sp.]